MLDNDLNRFNPMYPLLYLIASNLYLGLIDSHNSALLISELKSCRIRWHSMIFLEANIIPTLALISQDRLSFCVGILKLHLLFRSSFISKLLQCAEVLRNL